MKIDFYQHILEKYQRVEAIPTNKEIAKWATDLIQLLYPQQKKINFTDATQIEAAFKQSEATLWELLQATKACQECDNKKIAAKFYADLPKLCSLLDKDAQAIVDGDPAAIDEFEVVRTYPGFMAIAFYRIAHKLLRMKVPLLPRILTEHAHSKTGIDIHPGAEIGEYFFIDHGTGIVIGETTTIGNNVKLYQGVNLGALSVSKSLKSKKRHPTVEDNVVIYSGATILGGNTIIGAHSIIGGNVWLVKSVPAYSKVYHKPAIEVIKSETAFQKP